MPTAECNQVSFEFEGLFSRKVVAGLAARSALTGGSLLLREVERRTGIIKGSARCFPDHHAADRIEHSVWELVAQRVYALAPGYEDLDDHDRLRADPLLTVLADKARSGRKRP